MWRVKNYLYFVRVVECLICAFLNENPKTLGAAILLELWSQIRHLTAKPVAYR